MDKKMDRLQANRRFIEGRGCDISLHKTFHSFPLHYHEFFEIDFVLSGEAVTTINGIPYRINKGSVLFLTPIDFHDFEILTDEPLITYNIVFDFSIIYSRVCIAICEIQKTFNEE